MRQDILGGLRNAIERGSTQEQAVQSFISAGYKESEVREAARYLEQGVLTMMQPISQQKKMPAIPAKPFVKPQPLHQLGQQKPSPTSFNVQPQQRKTDWIVIILITILVLSIAGFISSLLFRKQVAEFLGNLI